MTLAYYQRCTESYMRCHAILICQPKMCHDNVKNNVKISLHPRKTVTSQKWLLSIEISLLKQMESVTKWKHMQPSSHDFICAFSMKQISIQTAQKDCSPLHAETMNKQLICVCGCQCWSNDNHYCTNSALLCSSATVCRIINIDVDYYLNSTWKWKTD